MWHDGFQGPRVIIAGYALLQEAARVNTVDEMGDYVAGRTSLRRFVLRIYTEEYAFAAPRLLTCTLLGGLQPLSHDGLVITALPSTSRRMMNGCAPLRKWLFHVRQRLLERGAPW